MQKVEAVFERGCRSLKAVADADTRTIRRAVGADVEGREARIGRNAKGTGRHPEEAAQRRHTKEDCPSNKNRDDRYSLAHSFAQRFLRAEPDRPPGGSLPIAWKSDRRVTRTVRPRDMFI